MSEREIRLYQWFMSWRDHMPEKAQAAFLAQFEGTAEQSRSASSLTESAARESACKGGLCDQVFIGEPACEPGECWAKECAARAATEIRAAPSEPLSVDGWLCYAWGETDYPCAEFVTDRAGVEAFIVREWLGDKDSRGGDGEPSLPGIMEEFDEHDWGPNEDPLMWEFEIGGIRVSRCYGLAALRPSAVLEAAPLTDERATKIWNEAYEASQAYYRGKHEPAHFSAVFVREVLARASTPSPSPTKEPK